MGKYVALSIQYYRLITEELLLHGEIARVDAISPHFGRGRVPICRHRWNPLETLASDLFGDNIIENGVEVGNHDVPDELGRAILNESPSVADLVREEVSVVCFRTKEYNDPEIEFVHDIIPEAVLQEDVHVFARVRVHVIDRLGERNPYLHASNLY